MTPSTTAILLYQSRKSLGVRPSNFFSHGTGEVAAVVGEVPHDDRWYFAKAVLYYTTAVPDAIQQYFAVVVLRYTRGFSVCRMYDTAVLLYSYHNTTVTVQSQNLRRCSVDDKSPLVKYSPDCP